MTTTTRTVTHHCRDCGEEVGDDGCATHPGAEIDSVLTTTTITTRRDAVQYVEDRLGSEGSRALAEAMVSGAGWRNVATLTDAQWAEVLDEAIAETTAATCDECGDRRADVRAVTTAARNANVCRACVPGRADAAVEVAEAVTAVVPEATLAAYVADQADESGGGDSLESYIDAVESRLGRSVRGDWARAMALLCAE